MESVDAITGESKLADVRVFTDKLTIKLDALLKVEN